MFLDNFYASVAITRLLLDRNIRVVGTLRKSVMTDFSSLISLGNARSLKPSRRNPKGTYKMAKTLDGKIFVIGLMDTSAVYFLDSAFGFQLVDVSRKQKGMGGLISYLAPLAVAWYNKYMGGVDELDRLRMGLHGFEGIGKAHKWTTRFFDAMINILIQTAYRIYKWNRDNKHGNLPALSHAEFNESVIEHFLHNIECKAEKLSSSESSRCSVRLFDVQSSVSSSSPLKRAERHEMEYSSEKFSKSSRQGRTRACVCKMCQVDPLPSEGAKKLPERTQWYCLDCSKSAIDASERLYLHPQCFTRYHNRLLGEQD